MSDTILHRLSEIIGKDRAVDIYRRLNESRDRLGTDPEIVELMSKNPKISALLADHDQVFSEVKRLFSSGEFGIARSSTFKSILRIRALVEQRRSALHYLKQYLSEEDIELILLAYNIVYREEKCSSQYANKEDQELLSIFRKKRENLKWKERAHRIYNIVASQYLDEVIIPEMMEAEQESISASMSNIKIIDKIQSIFNKYLKYNENTVWVNSHNSEDWIEKQILDRIPKKPAEGIKIYCRAHNWDRVEDVFDNLKAQYPELSVTPHTQTGQGAGGYFIIKMN